MADVINFTNGKGNNNNGNRSESFGQVEGILRENLLMETAMKIQEVFDDMFYARLLDPDKVEESDEIERMNLFKLWTREFEETYHGTEDYNNDFISVLDGFAISKIQEVFGNGQEAIRSERGGDHNDGT